MESQSRDGVARDWHAHGRLSTAVLRQHQERQGILPVPPYIPVLVTCIANKIYLRCKETTIKLLPTRTLIGNCTSQIKPNHRHDDLMTRIHIFLFHSFSASLFDMMMHLWLWERRCGLLSAYYLRCTTVWSSVTAIDYRVSACIWTVVVTKAASVLV